MTIKTVTPRQQIAIVCQEANKKLLSSNKTRPITVSSKLLYVKDIIDPIGKGFEFDYISGNLDDILESYHTEIYEAFEGKA